MSALLQENVSLVDSGSSLGLDPESVQSYRVGDQLRTVGSRWKTAGIFLSTLGKVVYIHILHFKAANVAAVRCCVRADQKFQRGVLRICRLVSNCDVNKDSMLKVKVKTKDRTLRAIAKDSAFKAHGQNQGLGLQDKGLDQGVGLQGHGYAQGLDPQGRAQGLSLQNPS